MQSEKKEKIFKKERKPIVLTKWEKTATKKKLSDADLETFLQAVIKGEIKEYGMPPSVDSRIKAVKQLKELRTEKELAKSLEGGNSKEYNTTNDMLDKLKARDIPGLSDDEVECDTNEHAD